MEVRRLGGCEEGVDKYVDLRVDDHPDPVNELIRLFRMWEITILTREDPNDVVELADVAEEVQRALKALGYYEGPIDGRLTPQLQEALERWMSINNFENKMRRDGKLWGTVYRFLLEEARRKGQTRGL